MNAIELLKECESIGVSVRPLNDGKLYVDPIAKLTDDLREQLVANKPAILDYLNTKHRLHIHRVWVKLKSIQPYRSGDSIKWRGEPTPEQHQLLKVYEQELLAALRPQLLSMWESEALALWLHDIGATTKQERDYVRSLAQGSASDRVALLWMADGSPELSA